MVVSPSGKSFVLKPSGKPFRPWGVNYGNNGRLIEDFWEQNWNTVEGDFREIRKMGGNVVRVHLQFPKFMEGPNRINTNSFERLTKLVKLAETTGLYLDLTGLASYRRADRAAWYDRLNDEQRGDAQSAFWRAVAERCANSPAIFCYDLVNEPISPGDKVDEWYTGAFGGLEFLQFIARENKGRYRAKIAVQWIDKLTSAIREKDKEHLITVGLLPWGKQWHHLSGFIPASVAPHLDFLSVHIYPKSKDMDESIKALQECDVGKPVVIEETFPLECSIVELEDYLLGSRQIACGWVWHYDGITIQEYEALKSRGALTVAQSIYYEALKLFVRLRPEFLKPLAVP